MLKIATRIPSQSAASKMVNLTEEQLDIVAGGVNTFPGFGVATAFTKTTDVANVLNTQAHVPDFSPVSNNNGATVAGGHRTAGEGNPQSVW